MPHAGPGQPPWRASEPVGPPNTGAEPEAAQRPTLRAASGKIIDISALIG